MTIQSGRFGDELKPSTILRRLASFILACIDLVADIAAQVGPAALQVEHDIADPLARPVIGVLAAAPGGEDREAVRRQQIGRLGAGAGGVERRVLEQPDQLARRPRPDGGDPGLHDADRLGIGHQGRPGAPVRSVRARKSDCRRVALANHGSICYSPAGPKASRSRGRRRSVASGRGGMVDAQA